MLHLILMLAAALMHPQSSGPVAHEREVLAAIDRTIELDCHGDGALGSCELDALGLLDAAWEEGRFCGGRECRRGDHNRSSSTFQTMGRTPEETNLYERDMLAAARHAYAVIQYGARTCKDNPLATYAGGCNVPAARRIGRARLAKVRFLWAEVQELLDPDGADDVADLLTAE